VATLLLRRGIVDEEQQRAMLSPRLASLRKPDAMAGFADAIDLILTARKRRWRVGVFGDYDVDGVTTTSILAGFLERVGVEVVCKVATRGAGYGFTVGAAESLAEAGVRLVLTGDTGTSDHEALEWLRQRDIPTVVIDHHQVPEVMPPAAALINPHQAGCGFPFKGLCSAGVAFYLAAALRTALAKSEPSSKPPDPRIWLDLAAIGTVCDMVPLVDENRVLVRHGLSLLDQRRRPGLAALLARAGVSAHETLSEEHVGFRVGPRLNAPGRLGSAEPALRLLRARNAAEADALAAELETYNAKRKAHQQAIVEEASTALAADPKTARRHGIVVAGEGWLPGIVGIAAAGIVEEYRRPALVLAVDRDEGEARGSARSVEGIDVRAALARCEGLLDRFGGHRQAAGVSLAAANVEALIEAFDEAVGEQVGEREVGEDIEYDGELSLERVDGSLVEAVRGLGPYGVGFPAPLFHCEEAVVQRARVIKQQHVSLRLRQGRGELDAIAFRQAHLGIREGDRIGLLFEPVVSEFRGRKAVELLVKRMWSL
jgi:single-stranded-DNA-specific exonuclease